MQATANPVLRDIVLIGGGHSHVGVLRMFAMQPVPGVRLTLVCTDTDTPYSGMLPATSPGITASTRCISTCAAWPSSPGARYVRDEVTGIDRAARKVLCRNRPPLAYDALSINIGSTPRLAPIAGAAEHAVPVKPIRPLQRTLAGAARPASATHAGATTIAVVGAGAGGVELLLAMQFRLRNELAALGRAGDAPRFHLFSADARILPTHNAAVRRAFEGVLAERGVTVHCDAEVTRVEAGRLQTRSGAVFDADEIVWVTQAGGAAWLRETGLALDGDGFIRVRDTLQSETEPAGLRRR
jgi:selenide,water dikinase